MPRKVIKFLPTPNPNALKCVLDASLPEPVRSFRRREEAESDPLGRALFSVPGVAGVLLAGEWMTINKSPDADWEPVKSGVQAALKAV
ncbi:MAG: NifU N-terminal domain-containing protein [Phycisphaeraceae bacterium]|nr:NifU N-terminal domain-containing protein [Phycisphaeraceae bacterium]MBX3408191.1 NifU N-terminal domain-containing protein [Phycisphaeraceae bacterium]